MRRYLFATLVVTALGCQSLERARECRVLADAVNPTLTAMDVDLASAPVGWATLDRRLLTLSKSLSTLRLTDPKLSVSQVELTDNFVAARQATSLGMKSRSRGQNDDGAVSEWVVARNRHANIVRGLLKYCRVD